MIPFQLHRRIPFIRRPFYQKDQAIAERDELAAHLAAESSKRDALQRRLDAASRERDAARVEFESCRLERDSIAAEKDRALAVADDVRAEQKRSWLRHRPVEHLAEHRATVDTVALFDDGRLIERITAAYRAATETALGSSDSFWFTWLADPKQDIHEVLLAGDKEKLGRIFRQPGQSALFYGFENLFSRELPRAETLDLFWDYQAPYDVLRGLAEALGLSRLENPENYYHGATTPPPEPDQLLKEIGDKFGRLIRFPNPFFGEAGLATSGGVATYRAVQAIYQAWRIAEQVSGIETPRILEIGGGLGRTAYYASTLFGIADYTLIDLPMTSVSQGYFLGSALGEDAVCLFGESGSGIRVLPPAGFLGDSDRYDLVVNIDSLTEMAIETASSYIAAIKARAGMFLSINHEANSFTAAEVCAAAGMTQTSRNPYWLRRGYVDEVFKPST